MTTIQSDDDPDTRADQIIKEVLRDVREKLRARRKMGELLEKTVKHEGGRPKQSQDATVLSDLGLDKHESSRLQQEASIPEPEFQEHVEDVKAQNGEHNANTR